MKIPNSIYKFVVSGGIATCIDFVCYFLLLKVFWPSIAKALSMIIANVWSYTVNRRWVFSSNRQTDMWSIGQYAVVQLINLSVNVGVNTLMLRLTGHVVLSFIIATGCATIVNYSLQKLFVFK